MSSNLERFRRVFADLPELAWRGTTYRSVGPRFATSKHVVSGRGSQIHGGRWNPEQSFPTLYTSLSLETALAESLRMTRRAGLADYKILPRVFVAFDVELVRVVDLLDGKHRQRLGVSRRRMTQIEWLTSKRYATVSQQLGQAAFELGWEALLVPSAAYAKGRNLVIFLDNLQGSVNILRAP